MHRTVFFVKRQCIRTGHKISKAFFYICRNTRPGTINTKPAGNKSYFLGLVSFTKKQTDPLLLSTSGVLSIIPSRTRGKIKTCWRRNCSTMCLANHNCSNLLRQSTSSLKSASPIEDLSDDVDWRSKMNSVFLGFMEQ